MSRRLFLPAAALLALALAACGGGSGPSLEEALQRMVLQTEDLPEGFVAGQGTFTTNDDVAAGSAERKALLEEWGRLLGYDVTFGPTLSAGDDSPVSGVNVSASLYETEQGASESFADAVKTAAETDWAANYAGLTEFQQEEIEAPSVADDVVWLRLSGLQPAAGGGDELVTDDLIFFRESRERGFLRVQAISADSEDRSHTRDTVEGWLRALVTSVQSALPDVKGED